MNYSNLIVHGERLHAMDSSNQPFPCTKCGACCLSIHQSELYAFLLNDEGKCKHLTKEHQCSIYSTRPSLCNIEHSYEAHFKTNMSKENFYKLNAKACNELQERLGIDERFRVFL